MDYNILHIEDSITDADIVQRLLYRSGLKFQYRLASDRDEVKNELVTFQPDIILCDHSLPTFNSKMAYEICKEKNPDLPFILVTGTVSEEFAVEMLKLGADDYILKSNLQRLPAAVTSALSKKETKKKLEAFRSELQQSEAHLRTIFENSSNGLLLIDKDFTIIEFNSLMAEFATITVGRPYHKNENLLDQLPQDRRVWLKKYFRSILKGKSVFYEFTHLYEGNSIIFLVKMNPVKDAEGKVRGCCISAENVTERKKAEKELSDYKYALDESSIVAITDQKGIIKRVNENFCKTSKYSVQELIGQNHRIINSGLHPKSFIKNLWVTITKGEIWRGEMCNRAKDGMVYWVDTTIVPFLDDDGKPIQYIAINKDITKRKNVEAEIKLLSKRLQLATRSAGMGIWDWNIETDHLIWDQGMYSLYKIDNELFASVYREWISRIHPDDQERVHNEIQMAVTGKKLYDTEFRIVWPDQSVRYIQATGITESDVDGNTQRMIGANWDVTSQKEKERHLKLLESVITNTTDAVVITEAEPFDLPGPRIVYVNEAFTKMTGYSPEEVINKSPRILQGPKTDKEELKRLSEAIRKWQPCEITIINYKKNGEEFWINFSVSPVANEIGWYTHWIAIERDVTEQKLVEIQLKKLNNDLKKQAKELALSNSELEQFAYVASHDLQEPLRMVTSFLTLLEKKYGDVIDENGKKYIAFAVDGAKRMRQIILDLLEFSRVGTTDDDKEKIDLNELLNEIKILFRKNIEEQKAVIKTDSLPILYTHLSPLRQVFQNLIGNALKYSGKETQPQIHITVKELKDHWQFAVIDNGIGIEKAYFDKIFIIFQRLHKKDEYSGTGMGLAITKKIIERFGGKIWVESEVGKGSTFYFTIKK
jgi:PAS domain S-box-containing protein